MSLSFGSVSLVHLSSALALCSEVYLYRNAAHSQISSEVCAAITVWLLRAGSCEH